MKKETKLIFGFGLIVTLVWGGWYWIQDGWSMEVASVALVFLGLPATAFTIASIIKKKSQW